MHAFDKFWAPLFIFSPSPMEAASMFISRSPCLTIFLLSLIIVSISAKPFKLPKSEKMSHLHFYFHDIVSGPNPTAMKVVETTSSAAPFGTVVMIDDPLMEGPHPKSKLLGRAQGLYAVASQKDAGLLMALNNVFVEGKYNGSTLGILGRNAVFNEVREMQVVINREQETDRIAAAMMNGEDERTPELQLPTQLRLASC